MDSIQEKVPDVVVVLLLVGGPQERHGFAVGGLGKGCEGDGDVSVLGDVAKTPRVERSSWRLVGGTIRRMGSKFLAARRTPEASTSKPKKTQLG